MRLYLITQNLVEGYDTYDSAVVAAESSDDARKIHPSNYVTHITDGRWMGTYSVSAHAKAGEEYDNDDDGGSWVKFSDIDRIAIEYLGETDHKRGLILASFNAG